MTTTESDYKEKINLVKAIARVMAYDYSEYDAMNNNPTPEEEAVDILNDYLFRQREKLLDRAALRPEVKKEGK